MAPSTGLIYKDKLSCFDAKLSHNLASPPPLEIPLPKARRARQSKPKAKVLLEEEESETVESSSPTPTPDSKSPPPESNNLLGGSYTRQQQHGHQLEGAHSTDDESEKDSENMDEAEESSDEEHGNDKVTEGEKEEGGGKSDDDDDDYLDRLIIKAQESLKRKAMFEEKPDEPRFSFPKLETGLDTNSTYIMQQGTRAKIDVNNVIVVEKGNTGSKSNIQSALEACEINMNAQKVHISKKQKKEEKEKTAGKGWFDLPQQILTPELKRDLQILKLRNVLDPKRFYKREEKGKAKFPKYFQVGTIIEGNTEFYSSRLTKKERATTITGEVMKDLTGRDYYKRKFNEIQESKQSGGKRFNKKGKGKQSKSWRAGK
ncbi:hypothetical protein BGX21_001242 [Mortierella sp. AD011]|nr:hypothetical protein BGX21_001242 [Mortierella sp. AD011]